MVKLDRIIDGLTRSENSRNLLLAEIEHDIFERDWESGLKIRDELKDKHDELKGFKDNPKQAIFDYSRAEDYSTR